MRPTGAPYYQAQALAPGPSIRQHGLECIEFGLWVGVGFVVLVGAAIPVAAVALVTFDFVEDGM
jgi:hypothetical protein